MTPGIAVDLTISAVGAGFCAHAAVHHRTGWAITFGLLAAGAAVWAGWQWLWNARQP